ncbi:M1 family aminopeptidase, partial [Staphylococcus gallinarum]|uniref:M1 family aminopeptidase n=1 Tax=Staphylococcus gallinarum TaxID=1293 RepID=UPI00316D1657
PAFPSEFDYGLVVYAKTAVWLRILETAIGRQQLEKGMQSYFSTWKFRHPYPEDLQATLEQTTGRSLDQEFSMLHHIGSF